MQSNILAAAQVSTLARDLVQCSLPYNPESVKIEDLLALGLELPSALESAVKKRQIDFLLGRICAKSCLETLGYPEPPQVKQNDDRSPGWPEGVLGSITHTRGYVSAIVGKNRYVKMIGVDCERLLGHSKAAMVQQICVDNDELEQLVLALNCAPSMALTLIFSAKESLFKAIYPLINSFFGFHAARVEASAGELTLRIRLEKTLSEPFVAGRSWPVSFREFGPELLETKIIELR